MSGIWTQNDSSAIESLNLKNSSEKAQKKIRVKWSEKYKGKPKLISFILKMFPQCFFIARFRKR